MIRGVPAEELLLRAPEQARYALSEGADMPTAMDRGTLRIVALVATGLQLAHTHSARHVFARQGVTRYRRNTRVGACDLCSLSAGQVYRSADLMPIHDGCACTVVPIWSPAGLPGTDSTLDEAYHEDVAIHSHDEIGPVLTDADHTFGAPHG